MHSVSAKNNPLRPLPHTNAKTSKGSTTFSQYPMASLSSSSALQLRPADEPFSSLPGEMSAAPAADSEISQLWSQIENINTDLPTPFKIQRETLERALMTLSRRYDQIDRNELVSKHLTGLKHSYVIGRDENGDAFLLLKPCMRHRTYSALTEDERVSPEAKAVIACGATKMVKKSAVLITFANQHFSAQEYLTYSSDTDGNKNEILQDENGANAIRDGWKELAFFDPEKKCNRIIYIMPHHGKEVTKIFRLLPKNIQFQVLMEFIDKAKKDKPFDVKGNNMVIDKNNHAHFIDDKDETFRYTPHLHFSRGCDYDANTVTEKTRESARILCLTYVFWQLINDSNHKPVNACDALLYPFLDGQRERSYALKEISAAFAKVKSEDLLLTEELRKAYLSCLNFDQLTAAIHQLFDPQSAAGRSDVPPTRGIKRYFCCH